MYLFFDTETTGTPKNYKGKIADLNNWPRIIQLAWAMFDTNGNYLNSRCDLIIPDGWEIPKEEFWIKNGFSTENNKAKGVSLPWALMMFINEINNCDFMIAHNMDFDFPITAAEMIRYKLKATNKPAKLCTMKESSSICKIPGSYGNYKWPKLEELHTFLFGEKFDGAHDAMNDVMACAKCFFEMKNKQFINPTLAHL